MDKHYARVSYERQTDGQKTKTVFTVDTEDIIAIFAGLVALLFAVAMIVGWAPINAATVGIATCSGAGTVIAEIVKARRKGKSSAAKSRKPPAPGDDYTII